MCLVANGFGPQISKHIMFRWLLFTHCVTSYVSAENMTSEICLFFAALPPSVVFVSFQHLFVFFLVTFQMRASVYICVLPIHKNR